MPKAAKSPFFSFALEFRRREESKGRSFPGGIEQVVKEAGPFWNRLSDAERHAYKDQLKNHPNQNFGEKYTTQGVPYSQIQNEKQVFSNKQQTSALTISQMIQTAVSKHVLEKLQMYFISANYFCKTFSDVYVPAELAMVKYNLESGVQATLHELINPVKLPLGRRYEAKQLSEETHDLPIPPDAIGETDLEVLLQKILKFTDYSNKTQNYFPLITDENEVVVVESLLAQCYEESKIDYQFLVIPVGELFFHLKRATEKYGLDICTFPSKTMADILLKKDPYEYTSGIACEFHENHRNGRFCALSKAVRWTYILSDNCCLDLSIDLIAGCHLPLNANTTLCLNSRMTGTTTCTNQGQSDALSMVSSVQTDYTLPSIQKKYEKNLFNDPEDAKCSTATANPFHMIDVNDSAYDQNLPRKSADKIPVSTESYTTESKCGIIRQPLATKSGRGRGALQANNSVNAAQPSTSRQQTFF